jgi:transcriptional regulator with XRE-family HTH domain
MTTLFAETLKKLRKEKGITQEQLGKQMFVNHSTIARWESGTRLPDAEMVFRIADVLGADINTLLTAALQSDEAPNVIIVDDNKVLIADSIPVLEEVMPNAAITGFIWPQEAVDYAKANRVSLAIVDIELGTASGLDLCRALLDINPRTNIVFLPAYPDYSLDAWKTEASGFMLKPLTPESIKEQLKKLRYPFVTGGAVD